MEKSIVLKRQLAPYFSYWLTRPIDLNTRIPYRNYHWWQCVDNKPSTLLPTIAFK